MRRSAARFALPAALFIAVGGCLDDGLTEPSGGALTPGVWSTISGGVAEARRFTVNVPSGTGNLRVELRDGVGAADLRIRFGAEPEPLVADCVSAIPALVQECIIASPSAGTWHIEVKAANGFAGVRLRATLGAQATATALASGVAVTALNGNEGTFRMYSIDVPANYTLNVGLTGGTGDADLYIRRAAWPLINQFDCASQGPDTNESCSGSFNEAQTWYVRLEGWESYNGVSIVATVEPPAPDRTP